jgi:ATP-dependent Clp protease, protease subunit
MSRKYRIPLPKQEKSVALGPKIYATLGGTINQETLSRIFLSLAAATQPGIKELHLLFQSTGGMVGDGIALYNYFKTMPINLHLYNGAAHRYASSSSAFMIHRTRTTPQGSQTATQMRAAARSVELDDARTEGILRNHTKTPRHPGCLFQRC